MSFAHVLQNLQGFLTSMLCVCVCESEGERASLNTSEKRTANKKIMPNIKNNKLYSKYNKQILEIHLISMLTCSNCSHCCLMKVTA